MQQEKRESWITGAADGSLEEKIEALVQQRISKGEYKSEDARYIEKLPVSIVGGALAVDDRVLEKLRRLCQLWDVEMKPVKITSHRKVIGPFIVFAKKLIFPLLKVFLKEPLRQQRDFNAAAIALLAELSNQNIKERGNELSGKA